MTQWAHSVSSAALCGTGASIFSHFHPQNCSLESLQLRVTKIPTGPENGPKAQTGWRASGVAHFTPPLRDLAHRRGQGSLERTKRHHHYHRDGAGLNKAWAHPEVKWANWAQVCLELSRDLPSNKNWWCHTQKRWTCLIHSTRFYSDDLHACSDPHTMLSVWTPRYLFTHSFERHTFSTRLLFAEILQFWNRVY